MSNPPAPKLGAHTREVICGELGYDDAAFEDSKSVADDANGADWPKSEGRKSDGKIIDDDAPDDAMTAVSQNSQKKEL